MNSLGTIDVFIALLLAGLLMVGAEVFLPGGILGAMGGILLLIAVGMAFAHDVMLGAYALVGVIILAGVMVFLWIKFFPRTWVGRRMTSNNDLREAKGTGIGYDELIGKRGVTLSGLRPGGFAEIEGKRVDVVADGEWIEKETPIVVLDVSGNRVIVDAVETHNEGDAQ